MDSFKNLDKASATIPKSYYSERSDAPSFRPQHLIDGNAENVRPYDMEFVEDTCNVPDPEATNALGMKANWYEESRVESPKDEKPEEEQVAPITLEELEAIRKAAYDDGFAEGHDAGVAAGHKEGYEAGVASGVKDGFMQGQAEGLKNGQEIVAGEAARFCRYANHLVEPIAALDTEISSELIYLAGRLARAFIKHEVTVNPAYLESAIADVCRLLPAASTGVSFRLNPQDCRLVRDTLGGTDLKLLPDPSLAPGDIAADAEVSSIDIRLEERIDKFLAEFMNVNSDKAALAPQNSGFEVDHSYDGVQIGNDALSAPVNADTASQNSEATNEVAAPTDENAAASEINGAAMEAGVAVNTAQDQAGMSDASLNVAAVADGNSQEALRS